jgi:predicted nicotinamide N-methyase
MLETLVSIGDRELVVLHPTDSEALIDEEAFASEQFLPYWAELWPSAVALARVVAGRAVRGARVVELGCGLGLPSLAAALAGADVLATDWSPDAVALTVRNAARNGVRLDAAVCDWSEPGRLVAGAPWDLVLASDVLYERRNVEILLALIPRLVDAGGEVLLADPGRPAAAGFLERSRAAWQVQELEPGVYVLSPVAPA